MNPTTEENGLETCTGAHIEPNTFAMQIHDPRRFRLESSSKTCATRFTCHADDQRRTSAARPRRWTREPIGVIMNPTEPRPGTTLSDVTQILEAMARREPGAADELLPIVYDELRRLAAARLRQEPPGQTLEATALVHEAYLRLVGPGETVDWDGRGHFFAAAAEAMRRILVENARRKHRLKHGGGLERIALEDLAELDASPPDELLALSDALDEFEAKEPEKARLVKLRYFAGLTLEEAAEAMGISRATASRHWTYARAWLYDRIGTDRDR